MRYTELRYPKDLADGFNMTQHIFMQRTQKIGFRRNLGMSIIELLVITGVIAVLAAITIGSLPRGNPRGYVRKEAEKLALDLRVAQNNAIIGKVRGSTTPVNWCINIRLTGGREGQFILFADANGNMRYNNNEDVATYMLENGVTFSQLSSQNGGLNELNVCFSVPYGDVFIYDNNSNQGAYGTARLSRVVPGGGVTPYKDITMRKSGQISITGN